jgi:predicted  nucleic acid-binding Zn-ribbon protein
MNPDLEHLIVLQSQDLELKRLREELAEAPLRVLAAQTARAKAEVALTTAKTALQKEEVLRRSQQTDVADRHGKIARLRKQMETAISAAQIAALEHEITFAEQTIVKLEDEELASMERTETFEAQKTTNTELLAKTTTALESERARTASIKEKNNAAITGVESERKALRALILESEKGEAVLSSYDRIAKAKGTAVSEALDHKCTACQMLVRPQRWNDLTGREHDHTIFSCETCGRMLFWDPRRDSPGSFAAGDRLHAAKALEPHA